MIIFIVYELYIVATRKHPVVSIKEVLNNMDDTHGGMAPFHYGFDISVGLLTTDIKNDAKPSSNISSIATILPE